MFFFVVFNLFDILLNAELQIANGLITCLNDLVLASKFFLQLFNTIMKWFIFQQAFPITSFACKYGIWALVNMGHVVWPEEGLVTLEGTLDLDHRTTLKEVV